MDAKNTGGNQQINVNLGDLVPLPKWIVNLSIGYLLGGFAVVSFLAVAYWNLSGEIRRLNTEIRLQSAYVATLTAELVQAGHLDSVKAARMQVLLQTNEKKEKSDANP